LPRSYAARLAATHTTAPQLTGPRKRGYVVTLDRSDKEAGIDLPASAGSIRGRERRRAGHRAEDQPCGALEEGRSGGRSPNRTRSPPRDRGVTPARRHQIDAREAKPRPEPSSSAAPGLDSSSRDSPIWTPSAQLQWRNHFGRDPSAPSAALAAGEFSHNACKCDAGRSRQATRSDCGQDEGATAPNSVSIAPRESRDARRSRSEGARAAARVDRRERERVMVLEKGFAWNGKSTQPVADRQAITGTS